MKTAVHGFATKTITIATAVSQLQYNLGDYQQDNFGQNAKIIGLSLRVALGSGTERSRNDRPLITRDDSRLGYLNLVQQGKDRENVVYQNNLYTFVREVAFDLFIEPCKVNWDESVIKFESNFVMDGTKDIELNIFYIFDEGGKKVDTNIIFDNDFTYLGLKKYNLEVVTKADSRFFQLNYGRNPLGSCALLVGMRINDYEFVTLNLNDSINKENYLNSSFLTMKFGNNRTLLDTFPLGHLGPFERIGYSYFPMVPILAKDFDWSNCFIEVSDKSIPLDDHAYLVTFFYIDVNLEEWTATNK